MGGRGGLLCLFLLLLFSLHHAYHYRPLFFFLGSTNIAGKGGAGAAEVVGQALAWPVIREADPALSSHSGKQSKQEFTIGGLSSPFHYNSFLTSIQQSQWENVSGASAGHVAATTHGLLAGFQREEAALMQRSKMRQRKCV